MSAAGWTAFAFLAASALAPSARADAPDSYLSNDPSPLRLYDFPERPPALEIGDPFLGSGEIRRAWTLPTGAVWSPSLLFYGVLRSAVQTNDGGTSPRVSEWANRLDFFGNLRLSGTERVVVGFRPFDSFDNSADNFSGYTFEPRSQRGFNPDFRGAPTTLFFEGELGEIFPALDGHDRRNLDYGFSVGRQPLSLQDGLLVNDDVLDLVSVTRDHLEPSWASKAKVSAIFGWSQIERGDNTRDLGAQLYALSGYADLPAATVEGDAAFVDSKSDADGLYAGLGSIQRLGGFGTTLRANGSWAPDRETSKVGSGALLTAEINHGVSTRDDYFYLDGFWGLERFTSADRSPTVGGPLSRVGLLFSSVGLGRYGSPLNNDVKRSAGGALGRQFVLGEQDTARRELIFEIAGRAPTTGAAAPVDRESGGVGARYQQAFGRHLLGIVDAFAAVRRTAPPSHGARLELQAKF
ncbi:MAG TPA: hypothetical protein VN915_11175 [Elusimicrobiota bacterium]|nr:hypothetical protein [Elusimicrobiota bacterium]